MLEGPAPAVKAAYGRIRRDDRMSGGGGGAAACLRSGEERLFADWAMMHDPAQSLAWTTEEIADDLLERVSPAEVRRCSKRPPRRPGDRPDPPFPTMKKGPAAGPFPFQLHGCATSADLGQQRVDAGLASP